jgi:hypothetical protein
MAQILFLVALAAILAAVLFVRSAARSNPGQVIHYARVAGTFIIALLLLLLTLRGQLNAALMLAPALLPLLIRWRALRQRLGAARGPTPGQHSDVQTRFLRMTLDHDSGSMSGEVLEGRFQGRWLDDLSLDELVELWLEVARADEQSAAVLEAYLDRTHGEAWRDLAGEAADPGADNRRGGPGSGAMSRAEALEILGLEENPTPGEIKAAHRRLMQKLHPDQGGSTYLATKINQAKDLLLSS